MITNTENRAADALEGKAALLATWLQPKFAKLNPRYVKQLRAKVARLVSLLVDPISAGSNVLNSSQVRRILAPIHTQEPLFFASEVIARQESAWKASQ